MTNETNLNNIPKSFLDYLRVIVFDNVDFYEISTKDIIQMWNDTENKEAFKSDLLNIKQPSFYLFQKHHYKFLKPIHL